MPEDWSLDRSIGSRWLLRRCEIDGILFAGNNESIVGLWCIEISVVFGHVVSTNELSSSSSTETIWNLTHFISFQIKLYKLPCTCVTWAVLVAECLCPHPDCTKNVSFDCGLGIWFWPAFSPKCNRSTGPIAKNSYSRRTSYTAGGIFRLRPRNMFASMRHTNRKKCAHHIE